MQGRDAVAAFIVGVRRSAPVDLQYSLTSMNGQKAILARTADADGRPYFAIFIHSDGNQIHLLHVIAGRKLGRLT